MTNPTTKLAAMLPRGLAEHLPADDHRPEAAWLAALCTSGKDWESARVVCLLRTIANRKEHGGLGKAWLTLTLEKKPLADLTEAARETLEAELAERLTRLANALENSEGRHAAVNNADTPAHIDGVLLFDHRLAEFVEKLGEKGKKYAEQVRGDSRKLTEGKTKTLDLMRESTESWLDAIEKLRLSDGKAWTQSATFLGTSSGILTDLGLGMDGVWPDFELAPLLEAWLPTRAKAGHVILPLRVRELAEVVWKDVVGPRLEELAEAKRRPAALQIVVHESAMHFHSRSSTYDPASRNLTFDGRTLATTMGASFDLAILERGLGKLGSVASHRLFQWQVRTGHERYLRSETYPNVLEVDGGWSELARRLGLNPKKTTPNLRAMVYAQAHFRFQFPDGSEGNLLSYTERAAKGREKARVVITLGSPLLPSYVHGLSRAEGRKLVPMLRETPPLYGRRNDHGAQLTMSLAVMARLRAGAREIAEHGGARIDDDAFTHMADASGLKRNLIVPVRDLWLKGDTRAPPFLQRNNDGRINLHDHHDVERDFIEAAGKKEQSGAIGGKAAVKRKAGNLGRYSRK